MSKQPEARPAIPSLRVLHVEDEPLDAELVKETLLADGIVCEVVRVETSAAFQAALQQAEFDLILSDKSLPQFDGLEALALARARRPEIPFIFVSGTLGEELAIESLKKGATDYVLKQRLNRLAPVTRRALREAAEHAELKRSGEALQNNERRFRALIENSSDAISLLTADGIPFYRSPATDRIFGSPPPDWQPGNWLKLVHPDDLPHAAKAFAQVMRTPRARANITLRYRHVDGSWRWIEGTGTNLLDDPAVNAVVLNYRDVSERISAAAALAQSEAELRGLFAAMTDVVLVLDAGGRYLQIAPTNPAALVKPPADLLGRTVDEVLPPSEAGPIHIGIQKALREQQPVPVEYTLSIGGETIWFDGSVSPLGADKVIWIARDVTERKLSQERLLLSDQILQRVTSLVVVADARGQIIYVSPSIGPMLGFEPAEAMGDGWWRLTRQDAERGAAERELFVQTAKDEQAINPEPYERILRDRDGNLHWILWQDARGPDRMVIGVGTDISERKRADEALRQSEAKYRYLFEHNPNPMWVYDVETLAFLAVNDTAIREYGYARDEFLAMTIDEIRPLEDVSRLKETVASLPEHVARSRNWRHRLKDGRLIDVEITSQPIDFEGRAARLVSAKDMSEQRLAQQQLQQRADEFAALYEITRDLSGNQDLDSLLRTMTVRAKSLIDTFACTIYLFDPVRRELELRVSVNSAMPIGQRLRVGEGFVGRVAENQAALVLDEYSTWENRLKNMPQVSNARAIAGVPMLYAGELIGVLEVFELAPSTRRYSDTDIRLLALFAGHAAAAVHNARALEQVRRQVERLAALRNIDLAISTSFNLQMTLTMLLQEAMTQLGVDAAAILLLDTTSHQLEYAAGQGFNARHLERVRLALGQGHAGQAALERRVVHVADLRQTPGTPARAAWLAAEGFVTYFGAPLISKGQTRGVLELFHRSALQADPEWLNFFEVLASQAAIAIDNTQLFEHLQRSNNELWLAYDTTIEGWSRALDLRDKETEGHTLRVTELTMRLAQAMAFSSDELVHVRRGALLHDIGKMGVPDQILLKPGPLTDAEWTVMRRHPVYAYELLSPITFLRPALDIPYCHHEKWDGSGYPRGLKGQQIPLSARLFAMVDVWDALRSDRAYRPAWPEAKVRAHLQSLSGSHFEPQTLELFLKMEM